MKTKTALGQRIRKLRKEREFSQAFVAEKLGITQSAYSLIENSQNEIRAEYIVRISKLFDVTTDFLLTGEKNLVKTTQKNSFIPFIEVSAQASFAKKVQEENILEEYEFFRIPGYDPTKDCVLIEVEGDSMSPTIMPNDILICQIQHNMENVLDGSLAVIVTKQELLVKRLGLHSDSQYFWMENDNCNTAIEKKAIKKSQIIQLMMVRGKVSSKLIPHHEIISKSKMKTIEDELNMLKRELDEMKKRLLP